MGIVKFIVPGVEEGDDDGEQCCLFNVKCASSSDRVRVKVMLLLLLRIDCQLEVRVVIWFLYGRECSSFCIGVVFWCFLYGELLPVREHLC